MTHNSISGPSGRIFFLAGEHSGDLHGSLVLNHLKRCLPDLEIEGIGGPLMKRAGLSCLHSIDELAVIGFVEVLKNLRHFWTVLNDVKKRLRNNRPDMIVLIDYPGFNVKVAQAAKALGIHVLYYICPQVWAWNSGRIKKISQAIDEAVVVFPFEVDIWRNAGIPVNWFGHPLLGIARSKISSEKFRIELNLTGGSVISLLPGSRYQEVQYIFPALLDAAEIILNRFPDTRFLLPVAGTIKDSFVLPYLKGRDLPITMLRNQTYEAIAASDLALVASGTATLETAIIGTPMIVVYQTNLLTSIISKLVIQAPHIGLPNVLAGRQIVPEFIRWDFHPRKVALEAIAILSSPERQREIRSELEKVRLQLGNNGADKLVADHIVKKLEELKKR